MSPRAAKLGGWGGWNPWSYSEDRINYHLVLIHENVKRSDQNRILMCKAEFTHVKTLSWKAPPLLKAWISLMKLYLRYMGHTELFTYIGAWVWVVTDIFSNISSSMYSLCTPAETANPWINACTTSLSGRLPCFISSSAPCIVSVPRSEAALLQALWLPSPWSLRSGNRRSGSRRTARVLCHSHGVNLTRSFSWTLPLFSTWKFCAGGFCQLPARALDFLTSLSSRKVGPCCTFPGCSVALTTPVTANVQRHPTGTCFWTGRPGLCSLPAAAECRCPPGHCIPPASADAHRRTPGTPCSYMLRGRCWKVCFFRVTSHFLSEASALLCAFLLSLIPSNKEEAKVLWAKSNPVYMMLLTPVLLVQSTCPNLEARITQPQALHSSDLTN